MFSITRAVILYFFLILMMRIIGRRTPTQMSPFEIIIIMLFGGMASQAILDDDRSLTNIVLCLVSVGMTHLVVSTLKLKLPILGRILDGTPVVVFSHGKWHEVAMNRVRVQHQDIMSQARKQGLEREEQIKYAIVERNGSISIIKNL